MSCPTGLAGSQMTHTVTSHKVIRKGGYVLWSQDTIQGGHVGTHGSGPCPAPDIEGACSWAPAAMRQCGRGLGSRSPPGCRSQPQALAGGTGPCNWPSRQTGAAS